MKEELEKKSVALQIVEFKYTLPIVIGIFFMVMLWVMVMYFKSGPTMRASILTFMSLFGSSVLVFNLLLIIYRELRESVHLKKSMILAMDTQVVSEVKYIFRELMNNKDTLGQLHDEIIYGKMQPMGPNGRPVLTYYESNFLFITFQIMLNFYRNYEFNTKDKNTRQNYNGWRNFLLKISSSAKVQQFYGLNKHLLNDLLFNKFMSLYVLPYVEHYVPIEDLISDSHRAVFNKHYEKWKAEKLKRNIENIDDMIKKHSESSIRTLKMTTFM